MSAPIYKLVAWLVDILGKVCGAAMFIGFAIGLMNSGHSPWIAVATLAGYLYLPPLAGAVRFIYRSTD